MEMIKFYQKFIVITFKNKIKKILSHLNLIQILSFIIIYNYQLFKEFNQSIIYHIIMLNKCLLKCQKIKLLKYINQILKKMTKS